MARKRPTKRIAAPVVPPPSEPAKRAIWQALTDDHGEFDVAQIGVAVAVVSIIALAFWARKLGQTIDFGSLGQGIALVIGALGVYKWGDKRPTPPQTTTTASIQQVTTP